jgi:hypothetical protein
VTSELPGPAEVKAACGWRLLTPPAPKSVSTGRTEPWFTVGSGAGRAARIRRWVQYPLDRRAESLEMDRRTIPSALRWAEPTLGNSEISATSATIKGRCDRERLIHYSLDRIWGAFRGDG